MRTRNMVMVVAMVLAAQMAASAADVFDIPRIDKLTIDGKLNDWGDRGFMVNAMTAWQCAWPEPQDLDARFRLAWDDAGLLLAVRVMDDVSAETEAPSDLWRGDGLELFVADKVGGSMCVQVLVGPGMGEKQNQLRTFVSDRRAEEKREVEAHVDAARTLVDGGYILEVRLPWDMLGVKAKVGAEAAFQIFVNDSDGGGREKFVWFPAGETSGNWHNLHALRLASKPSPPVMVSAVATYEYLRRVRVDAVAAPDTAGAPAVLRHGDKVIAKGTVDKQGTRAGVTLRAPLPGRATFKALTVQVGDYAPLAVDPGEIDRSRAQAMLDAELRFDMHMFGDQAFPIPHFGQPVFIEGVIGPYKIDVTHYNAAHEKVTTAGKPGRYGAVVTITAEDGRKFTRYRTLFRMPEGWDFWDDKLTGELELPTEFGIDRATQRRYSRYVNDMLKWGIPAHSERYPYWALTLAGMYEAQQAGNTGSGDVYDSPWARDRQWWVDQKRKMNGNDKRFATKLVCPRPIEGEPARTVHEGTMAEAGMVGDAPQKIDAVLTEWAADTDQPFIACVVRHGVVVLHKAYGTRDGKPMTTHTNSYMASLSKLVSGSCVMMAVDQGLIDLDIPIDTYSPTFKGAQFNVMPTMRHLYSHTAGMTSHRGEEDHELEHLCVEMAPFTMVADRYEYNGMSLELGLKLLEQVTGEAYPLYVNEHLLKPLGCEDTEALNASWNTRSTAMDMAKIGQMLLNGGAYGKHRFMSEKTRDAMLPRKLTQLGDNMTDQQYGVGTSWFEHDGLSDRCFGHGSAASATLRVDLKHDLVISMTRNNAGTNFGKYHPKFIQTVVECMVD